MSGKSGRKSRGSNKQLLPWASAEPDGKEKAFVQIGLSLLRDKRFHSLTFGARNTYAAMLSEARGRRDFIFPRAVAESYGIPSTSLVRHVRELQEAGFIELSSSGKATREPNFYRFSLGWKSRRS